MQQITETTLEAAKKAFEALEGRGQIIEAAVPGAGGEELDWWESLLYAHWHTVKIESEPFQFKKAAYDLVCMVEAAQKDFQAVCGEPLDLLMRHPVQLGRALGRYRKEREGLPLVPPTELVKLANETTLFL